jgi:hypothetical protein
LNCNFEVILDRLRLRLVLFARNDDDHQKQKVKKEF